MPERIQLRGTRRVGKRQRRDGVDRLRGDVERRAARDEERQPGGTDDQLREQRPGREHLFEVVEHEQHPPAAEVGDQDLRQVLPRLLA